MRWVVGIGVGALVSMLAGCVAGPSYAGGPTEEQPHAVIYPGEDVWVWKVDGWDTYNRSGAIYLEPGPRSLWLRVNNPMDHDGSPHRWIKSYKVRVEEGQTYVIYRGESDFPPWPIKFEVSRY